MKNTKSVKRGLLVSLIAIALLLSFYLAYFGLSKIDTKQKIAEAQAKVEKLKRIDELYSGEGNYGYEEMEEELKNSVKELNKEKLEAQNLADILTIIPEATIVYEKEYIEITYSGFTDKKIPFLVNNFLNNQVEAGKINDFLVYTSASANESLRSVIGGSGGSYYVTKVVNTLHIYIYLNN